MNEQSITDWLRLSLLPGMHSRLFNTLLDRYDTPARIFAEAANDETLKPAQRKRLAAGTGDVSVKRQLDRALAWRAEPDRHILCRYCEAYPALLQTIPDPPPLLYLHGNPEILSRSMVAMVGSRNPSTGGRRNAGEFARALVARGLTVVSGMAMGIDAASHQGALDGQGLTVGVLGTGIDRVYPKVNHTLFRRVIEQGCLVSEFPLGTEALPAHFPQRNRIISGLSQGVLVVEATTKSGSMITARFALEQGRDVFAVPGSIHNPASRGCHQLIKAGAKLVQTVEDIVEEFPGVHGPQSTGPEVAEMAREETPLSEDCRQIKAVLGYDPIAVDDIIRQSGLDTRLALAALMDLELRGLVMREAGGFTLAPS